MTGAELKTWREKRKITQSQLGMVLGKSTNSVCNWERDMPPPPKVLQFALLAITLVQEDPGQQVKVRARIKRLIYNGSPTVYGKLLR